MSCPVLESNTFSFDALPGGIAGAMAVAGGAYYFMSGGKKKAQRERPAKVIKPNVSCTGSDTASSVLLAEPPLSNRKPKRAKVNAFFRGRRIC